LSSLLVRMVKKKYGSSYFVTAPQTALLAVKIFPPPFFGGEVEVFDFFSCPGSFTQKSQTGFDRWVGGEAADGNAFTKCIPAVVFIETADDQFQGDAVERGFVVKFSHL